MSQSDDFSLEIPTGLPYVDAARSYDVSLEKLWYVQTDPDIVSQWIGDRVTEWDFRPGGRFAYEDDYEGSPLKFWGWFHDIREHEYMIKTFEFEGRQGRPVIERGNFESLGPDQSRRWGRAVYFDPTDAEWMLNGPIDFRVGVVRSHERLDKILKGL